MNLTTTLFQESQVWEVRQTESRRTRDVEHDVELSGRKFHGVQTHRESKRSDGETVAHRETRDVDGGSRPEFNLTKGRVGQVSVAGKHL